MLKERLLCSFIAVNNVIDAFNFTIVQETEQLESSNRELMDEIQRLEVERQQLMAVLESHKHGRCHCAYQSITREDLLIDPWWTLRGTLLNTRLFV